MRKYTRLSKPLIRIHNGITYRGNPEFVALLCPSCGNHFLVKFKFRKRIHCSRPCLYSALRKRTLGKAYKKFHGQHEHRVIAEQILGRKLLKNEVVHHKDENHLNNAPDNLEVISPADHMRKHGIGIPGVSLKHKPWEKRHVNHLTIDGRTQRLSAWAKELRIHVNTLRYRIKNGIPPGKGFEEDAAKGATA